MFTTIIHAAKFNKAEHINIEDLFAATLEACDGYHRICHQQPVSRQKIQSLSDQLRIDINTLPADFDPTKAKLLVSDMDSTLISIECIDEIADYLNVKPQVAAITESAMCGEIDFAASLTQRVALLKGVSVAALELVYNERLQLNPGAEQLIDGLKKREIKFCLVSGGFTFFTERLKKRLKLDYAHANQLEIEENSVTGELLGNIVDAQAKAERLLSHCKELGISPSQAISVGDGANDLAMMKVAGLSVAYHAKPAVQSQASTAINYGGLDSVLHLLKG